MGAMMANLETLVIVTNVKGQAMSKQTNMSKQTTNNSFRGDGLFV
jgi:hypothetical protein